ncbi:MAG: flippase-like domain-containing protein [Actinomycetota bacterium]|nr:flippase-like domain-containing protein [Actinomycetota bacterium]
MEREAATPEVEPQPEDEGDGLPVISTKAAIQTTVVIILLVAGIYFFLPKLAGFGDAIGMLGQANPVYVGVAIGFCVLSFVTYIALFRAVVGGEAFPITWREAYEINMAGFAATLLFSAGGAGGVVLTYWALRQGGMERRDVGTRMVAFIVLHYLFYPLAIVVFGVLLRTGVLNGGTAVSLTIVPAGIAGVIMILGLALALVPSDIERRIRYLSDRRPGVGFLAKLATVPATVAEGVRAALKLVAGPSRAGLAVVGAVGFWAANIGILWAAFKAFGIEIPFGVVVMGFFLGMVANLIPFVPAGVGAVDAGMIGVFVLFGFPEAEVFAAILIYRLVAFWLPIPPGVFAFFQLRKRVKLWKKEGLPIDRSPQPGMIKAEL